MREPAPPVLEVREPGRPPRLVVVDRGLEVGRECDGIQVADAGVSRKHVKFLPSPMGLSVVDLGSRNGTLVNGLPLTGRRTLEPGDVIRLGGVELMVAMPVASVPRAVPVTIGPRQTMMAGPAVLPPPPPAPAIIATPSRLHATLRALFTGAEPVPGVPVFRNYLEFRRPIPLPVWHVVRLLSILAYVVLCIALFVRPAGGLFTFFGVIVPLLPILFFVAPGLWRNICPLAAANQTPRVLRFSRALTPPEWLRRRGYVVAIVLFFGIAAARLAVFNTNGTATGILLSVTIVNAFLAGLAFKGKSGWCSSICPLLPLQRVYGQTPLVLVANTHCNPCVACTSNCYDFKPQPAQQIDLRDPDPQWSGPRRLFASALPGFVLGFFMLVGHSEFSRAHVYERLGIYVVVSIGLFFAVEALVGLSTPMVVAVWGSAALNIFYWFGARIVAHSLQVITGGDAGWVVWPIRVLVAMLTVVWLSRTYWNERRYLVESGALPQPIAVDTATLPVAADAAEVSFDGVVSPAEIGASLLELAEDAGLALEAGCRMGVCGADPVAVLDGSECLSAPAEEELQTLRRLGLAPTTRMACCARIQHGSVEVSLTPQKGTGLVAPVTSFDRSITSVVVIGNGIAGVTAADFVRRGHPDCEVHVIGQETHLLYNRMGISRLVFGRSAMTGLHLLDEDWYSDNRITTWLNTVARRIDVDRKKVHLATGESLVYDRLVLAMGSSSALPSLDGFGRPGTFVLRQASDAMMIRSFVQQTGAQRAVVAGGGLLGLEAAFALHELGLQVSVLERGTRLLAKQIDERASALVAAHFNRLGIAVLYRSEAVALGGSGPVESVTLSDGRTVPCEVFLAAIGIRPNADLASAAGIACDRGVVVDDRMQTSVPGVYAAGDVAQHGGFVLGLWPIGAKQGEVAAVNALGGDERLIAEIPATILKGVGLELSAIGQTAPGPGDDVILDEDPSAPSYRCLVVSRGQAVGAIVLGHHPDVLATVTDAVKKRRLLDAVTLDQLRRGNWLALKEPAPVRVAAGRHG